MKRFLLFFFLIFISFINNQALSLPLKGILSGIVKDSKTGNPIEGVSIYITDLRTGSSTNSKGEYSIDNLSDGKHLMEISHLGYSTIAINIDI